MEQLWNLILNNFVGCLLVFARITGIFTFNPILGRQNVPMRVRVMMSIALSICVLAGMGGTTSFVPTSIPQFALTLVGEIFLGLVFGFFVNLVMTSLLYAGEITDNKMGFMMANIMDPGSGIQAAVFANFYLYIFMLYFFVTQGHLQYIQLFVLSYDIIPIGFQVNFDTYNMVYKLILFFGTSLQIALKLAMPILATIMLLEICTGVVMKAVPGIQIFILTFSLKILLGLVMVFALTGVIITFIDRLFDTMWMGLEELLYMFI